MSAIFMVNGLLVSTTCPWLPESMDQMARFVCHEAQHNIGVRENPPASNRGVQIDQWLREAGVPEAVIKAGKGYWCGAWAGSVWKRAGFQALPVGYADCDVIWRWAVRTSRFSKLPSFGAMVLYGKTTPPDAHHVGIVIDTALPVLTAEGNTTVQGSTFERNGTAVALKIIDAADPVLGYVHIRPLKEAA